MTHSINILFLSLGLWFSVASCAFGTTQVNDTIVVGGHRYGIFQLPMSSFWHHDDEPAEGRQPVPKFEAVSSSNWRGYLAEWSISGGKLRLVSIEGQLDGKKVRDQQIINKRFPIHATWFTGKIYVAVGDYDDKKHAFDMVLEFNIEQGNIRSTAFYESLAISMTLNGLPEPTRSSRGSN